MGKLSRRGFLGAAGATLGAWLVGCSPAETPEPPPEYVDAGPGAGVFRGPYEQRNAHIAAFLLAADAAALREVCDASLNEPSDHAVAYAPFGPYALLVYADMQIQSLDERDREMGWLHETEVGLWIPLIAHKSIAGVRTPDHIAWLLPYLFVDNPYAIAAGREVYGFAKMWAAVNCVTPFEPGVTAWPEFTVDVWGFEASGPQAEGKLRRLLAARALDTTDGALPGDWTTWDAARSALIRQLLDVWAEDKAAALGAPPAAAWLTQLEATPLVFLKQFRDAADPAKACYQAVIEAPLRVTAFRGGGALQSGYALTFTELVSHPVVARLGLHADADGIARPLASAWLDVDFTLGLGREVWRA
ncbi:MAG TPA: twin-arginine translocation signal domain-containing protein [Anaerolineae bacterium]|nr:twin-arginine translocation signal domain-containing protein [Anaerolineae bacterium]